MRRLFPVLLVLAACSGDSTGPDCSLPKACAVRGIDLAIIDARIDSSAVDWERNVAHAAAFEIRVDVLNRGSRTAPASRVQVDAWIAAGSAAVPGLEPGETASVLVPLAIERQYLVFGKDPDAITPVVSLDQPADSDPSNDTLLGDEFRLDLPRLALHGNPRAPQRARIGQQVTFSGGVARNSEVVFTTTQVRVLFCVLSATRGCDAGSWGPLQTRLAAPNVSAPLVATVGLRADAAPAAPGIYRLAICMIPVATEPAVLDRNNPHHACADAGELEVLP